MHSLDGEVKRIPGGLSPREEWEASLRYELEAGHGWGVRELRVPARARRRPRMHAGMLYAGRRHVLFGELDAGKTFLALVACAEEILGEEYVLWLNYEVEGDDLAERLAGLGCGTPECLRRFLHVPAKGPC